MPWLLMAGTTATAENRWVGTKTMQARVASVPGQHRHWQTDDAIGFHTKLGFWKQPEGLATVSETYLENETCGVCESSSGSGSEARRPGRCRDRRSVAERAARIHEIVKVGRSGSADSAATPARYFGGGAACWLSPQSGFDLKALAKRADMACTVLPCGPACPAAPANLPTGQPVGRGRVQHLAGYSFSSRSQYHL